MFTRRRIEIKTPDQLRHMRAAGLVVAEALVAASEAAVPGATTAEVDRAAARVIAEAGAEPSFLGYYDYPAHICVSVNDEVVHGIPGPRVLAAGDLVSIDCGAIVNGWHGDAAVTVVCGGQTDDASARLSEVTQAALWAGIAAARVGATIGDVGHAVAARVAAAREGYGIVDGFTGHGIGSAMHMAPDVPNQGRRGRGARLVAGMAIAIEPMVTIAGDDSDTLDDGWTVVTSNSVRAAHWEHTVVITPAGPWVTTAPDGGGLADDVALASFG